MSPLKFFKGILPAAVFAFTSTSSVASLPVSKECCDEMGVENDISSFVLPLGATINMDGTAIYQCVAAIFLAKCIGVDLGHRRRWSPSSSPRPSPPSAPPVPPARA